MHSHMHTIELTGPKMLNEEWWAGELAFPYLLNEADEKSNKLEEIIMTGNDEQFCIIRIGNIAHGNSNSLCWITVKTQSHNNKLSFLGIACWASITGHHHIFESW